MAFIMEMLDPRVHFAVSLPTIQPPANGKLYHGVYPGGKTGEEDDITAADIRSYESAAGKGTAWVYFSDNWYRSRKFPIGTVRMIDGFGAVPYIRLMLRSTADQAKAGHENVFTLQHIIDGQFDADLIAWGKAAKSYGKPLLVEYGTEFNGFWFPWNARWNGWREKTGFGSKKKYDGPERFQAAFRHIVQTIRAQGATNVKWVWHVNNDDDYDLSWNRMERYYPGDDVVDWVAISAYGAQTPDETEEESFRAMMDRAYARMQAIAPKKPVIVAEFGHTSHAIAGDAAPWAKTALHDLFSHRWPHVIGFSWWNETWENDDIKSHDTDMRLQDDPALKKAFRDELLNSIIQQSPVVK